MDAAYLFHRRLELFTQIAGYVGSQKCVAGPFSPNYFTEFAQRVVVELGKEVPTAGVPVQESALFLYSEEVGSPFDAVVTQVMEKAFASESVIQAHNGRAFLKKEEDLVEQLSRVAVLEYNAVVAQYVRQPKTRLDAHGDVFPEERCRVTRAVVAELRQQEPGPSKAADLLRRGYEVVREELIAESVAQRYAALSVAPAEKPADSVEIQAWPLDRYRERIFGEERLASRNLSRHGEIPAVVLDELIAAATLKLAQSRTEEVGNLFVEYRDSGGRQLQATLCREFTETTVASSVLLPFVGKVVGATQAARLSRTICVPMRSVAAEGYDEGPDLFIDGGARKNPKRSLFCAAFMVPPVPKEPTARPASVPDEEPEKKKRKTLAGLLYTPVASLKVSHVAHDFNVECYGHHYKFRYLQPALVNTDNYVAAPFGMGRPVHRERTDWDNRVEATKSTQRVDAGSFAMR